MATIFRAIQTFSRRQPISRGMMTYAILWPSSNLCQQYLLRDKYDFKEAARFGVFGGLFIAPLIYGWVKVIVYLIPGQSLRSSLAKALVEQVVYAPISISYFYVGMSVLEGKSWDDTVLEWKQKFLPTYKLGLCIWPAVQTLNFAFISEKNRVPVLGTVSFFWTMFLSYMKHLELKRAEAETKAKSKKLELVSLPRFNRIINRNTQD